LKILRVYSDKSGETIPVYALSMGLKGEKGRDVNIDISKNGGKVVYMLNPRDVGTARLSMDEAIKKGSTCI
jgi:spore germination protein